MREGTRIAGGFWAALSTFGTMSPFKTPAEHITSITEELALEKGRRERFVKQGREGWLPEVDRSISDAERRLKWAKFMQGQDDQAGFRNLPFQDDIRDSSFDNSRYTKTKA